MKIYYEVYKNNKTGKKLVAPELHYKFEKATGLRAMVQSKYSRNYSVERPEFKQWAKENGWEVVDGVICTY